MRSLPRRSDPRGLKVSHVRVGRVGVPYAVIRNGRETVTFRIGLTRHMALRRAERYVRSRMQHAQQQALAG